ncbi:hypothetical protein [Paenibacillus durus]|uniref:hypothetical protein n=1 Tax=Paenibacillus durus TaxID=44251 RepID=UPI0012E01F88|nr:hypothetical protein [Paenibacillus durus]
MVKRYVFSLGEQHTIILALQDRIKYLESRLHHNYTGEAAEEVKKQIEEANSALKKMNK